MATVQHIGDGPRHDNAVGDASFNVVDGDGALAGVPVLVDEADGVKSERVLDLLQEVG